MEGHARTTEPGEVQTHFQRDQRKHAEHAMKALGRIKELLGC